MNYLSLGRFDEAIVLGREIGLPNFELKCIRQKGLTYWEMGKINLFMESNKRGLELSNIINHKIEKGRCLNNIGVYYQKQNDFSLALTYFKNALSIIKTTNDQSTEAECLSNLGITYRDLGNLSKAQFYLTNALELDKKNGDVNTILMDLDNIGAIYLRRGLDSHNKQDLLEAFSIFRNCLSMQGPENTGTLIQISAFNNIGIIKSALKDYSSAREYFISALKTVDKGKYLSEKCNILSNIAASFFYEGKIAEAIANYKEALEIGSKYSFENAVMESCLGLGQCFDVIGEYSSALSFYKRSIEATESVRDRISSEFLMIGFARNKMSAYEKAIKILVDQYVARPSIGVLEEIFNYVERAKARAFLENINTTWEEERRVGKGITNEREKELSKRISALSRELMSSDLPVEERKRINNELEQEEEEDYRLIAEMNRASRDRGQSGPNEVCTIAQVQNQILDNKTALFEYFLGDRESYLIYISRDNAKLSILAGRNNIERSLRAYLKVISSGFKDHNARMEAAKRIGRELIPVEEIRQQNGVNAIIIVPHGILHYLPFETISMSTTPGSVYLIEKFMVSYCPSASSLFALKQLPNNDTRKKELLALGGPEYEYIDTPTNQNKLDGIDAQKQLYCEQGFRFLPLPFSKKEVLEIAKLFKKSRVDVLVGKNASEDIIKKLPLNDYRLIHFACHGFMDNRFPFRSALVLSINKKQEEDGFLQMREVNNLTLSADLVVLSACQTGNGILERAEGPIGLARPFFYAGARSVLSSLWPINDKTTVAFMKYFYKYLVEGNAASKALQLAKIRMLQTPWSYPFYWAGFILSGDPGAGSINR